MLNDSKIHDARDLQKLLLAEQCISREQKDTPEWHVLHASSLCTAFRSTGLRKALDAFKSDKSPHKLAAFEYFLPAINGSCGRQGIGMWFLHNHLLGSCSMHAAQKNGDIDRLVQELAIVQVLSYHQGGYAGPLHGAIWQALLLGDPSGPHVWPLVQRLCSNLGFTFEIYYWHCAHGAGHGILYLALGKVQNVSWSFDDIVFAHGGQGLVTRQTLKHAVDTCQNAPNIAMANMCAQGLCDGYKRILFWTDPDTESPAWAFPPYMAHGCFLFWPSLQGCSHANDQMSIACVAGSSARKALFEVNGGNWDRGVVDAHAIFTSQLIKSTCSGHTTNRMHWLACLASTFAGVGQLAFELQLSSYFLNDELCTPARLWARALYPQDELLVANACLLSTSVQVSSLEAAMARLLKHSYMILYTDLP